MSNEKDYMKQVVCAAMKHKETGVIICSIRHFDPICVAVVNRAFPNFKAADFIQGFVNNKYEFMDRVEAKALVLENKQPLREQPEYIDLYSENLY